MHPSADAPLVRLEQAREELAKSWLQGIIDRTPLDEVGQVPVDWVAREAPALIADILHEAASPAAISEPGAIAAARLAELGPLRSPAATIHRDLAALHSLLLGALSREIHERQAFARASEGLAETIGAIQTALGESMLGEGADAPEVEQDAPEIRGKLGGLGGASELHDWLHQLVASHRRYGHPFAVMSIDVEGLGRVNEAFGEQTGDRVLDAVAETLEGEIRGVDRAFRLAEDDFCVLAPHHDANAVVPFAERLRRSIAGAGGEGGPPVLLAVGIASCPEHGESAVQLLDAAHEATYAAKAAGSGISISNGSNVSR